MKKVFLGIVLAAIAVPMHAFAQEAGVLEEITVTAQRREQSLQDVPISVTAFTGASLEQGNIRGATDFLALTPNVSFTEDGQSGSRGLGIAVRGVNNLVSGENAVVNSVGIYLDEFSVASIPSQVANPFLPDMERIEVLRGPQGTYFGRNSVGGALNLTTNRPTDEFGGRIIVGGESYDDAGEQFSLTGILNGPVSDKLMLRGVLYYEDSSGLVDNICASGASAAECRVAADNGFTPNGAGDSGHEFFMGRFRALWDVSDQTQVGFTLIYADEEQGTDENVPSGILDIDTVDTIGIEEALDPGTGFWPNNRNLLSHDRNEHTNNESTVGILNITHQINGNLLFKSITGFIDAELDRMFDQDLIGGLNSIGRDNLYEGFSWSTEARLESSSDTSDVVVGILFSKDDQEQDNFVNVLEGAELGHNQDGVFALPPFPAGLGLAFNNKNFEIEGIAVFGDVTLHLTDNFDLIAGARWTRDEVVNDLVAYGIGPTCCFPGSPGFPGGPGFDFFNSFANSQRPVVNAEETFTDVAPRFGFRYQVSDDVGIYGLVSKGYKAGGSSVGNDTNADGSPAFTVPYAEETLWNYEFGVKSELADRRVRLNAAVFYLDWNDLQFESFRFLTPGNIATNFEQTINIEDAEASGFELEILAVPSERFTISGGIGFLDTEITSDTMVEITGGFVVDLQGLDIPKAPELTANLAGDYRWPIGGSEGWVRLEFIHRDGQYSDIEGLTNLQTRGPSPNQGLTRPVGPNEFPYLSPDYDIWNLRGGFDAEKWSFAVYVQNLTDEEYYTGTQENFGMSGIRLRPHPMTIGANLTYRFGGI